MSSPCCWRCLTIWGHSLSPSQKNPARKIFPSPPPYNSRLFPAHFFLSSFLLLSCLNFPSRAMTLSHHIPITFYNITTWYYRMQIGFHMINFTPIWESENSKSQNWTGKRIGQEIYKREKGGGNGNFFWRGIFLAGKGNLPDYIPDCPDHCVDQIVTITSCLYKIVTICSVCCVVPQYPFLYVTQNAVFLSVKCFLADPPELFKRPICMYVQFYMQPFSVKLLLE